jgi:hypothetical protein
LPLDIAREMNECFGRIAEDSSNNLQIQEVETHKQSISIGSGIAAISLQMPLEKETVEA